MSLFFNGRLWSTPVAMSKIDESDMFNNNGNVGNILAVIGTATGGKPNTPLRFGSAAEAQAVLRSGTLLDAIIQAFDPSSQTTSPSVILGYRVNPATQGSLTLNDAQGSPVIDLVSTDYGLYTNQIKIKIESASVKGKLISTMIGGDYYAYDNIGLDAFTVRYTGGEATATMSINGSQVLLYAPAATLVSTIDLTVFTTVQQVIDNINTVAGFAATLGDGIDVIANQGLDFCTAQDVKTALYTVTAHLSAVVNWINGQGEGYVTATRRANVGTSPVNVGWTYLAGGSDGTTLTSSWQDSYTALQAEDVQWIVPASSEPAVHAMNDSHCAYMSNVARMERRGIVGSAIGTTDDQAIAIAKSLNSDRTSLVHIGMYDYNPSGKLVLYPPYILAALLGGMFSGVNPGTALTNKYIKVSGLERKLRNPTDTDRLLRGGVLCVEDTPKGYKVSQSISTWLINSNYYRVEQSVGVAGDYVARRLRDVMAEFIGTKGTPATAAFALARVNSTLDDLSRPEPMGIGVLAGDAKNPPYKGTTVSLEGDVLRLEVQCSLVIPINYIPIVIHTPMFKI
jgi:hypothetical protein